MILSLGIFDSGVGGFSVLKRVLERHGDVPSIYLADTARLPYGDKSPQAIRGIANEIIRWMKVQKVEAILIACNTTNSLALDVVEAEAGIPSMGLIRSAAEMIQERRIGVLATPATVRSGAYKRQIQNLCPNTFVLEQSCPEFVPFIEAGKLNSSELQFVASNYLRPLLDAHVEEIVLGCSHYPFLEPLLRSLLPENIHIIDPAIGLAKKTDILLGKSPSVIKGSFSLASTRFCVTQDPLAFSEKAFQFLGKVPEIEMISLQEETCFF